MKVTSSAVFTLKDTGVPLETFVQAWARHIATDDLFEVRRVTIRRCREAFLWEGELEECWAEDLKLLQPREKC